MRGAGKGVGAVKENVSTAELVNRLTEEFFDARLRLRDA